MSKNTKKPYLAAWIFYLIIAFEIVYMISPFAIYYYSVYGPSLNVFHSNPYTAWLSGFFLLLLVIAIPLTVIMSGVVQDTAARQSIHEVLEVQIASQGGELGEFEFRADRGSVAVVATIHSVHPLSQATVDDMAAALSEQLSRPVQLEVIDLPAIRSTTPRAP